MRVLSSNEILTERETNDQIEDESDALQEMRDLREDIRRKRDPVVTTASSESRITVLTDDEKIGLAVRTSVASMPGAYRGENQRRPLPKPSQEKLLATARRGVKEDSFRPQPNMGPHISSDEFRPIDDLQDRMKDFQLCTAKEDLGEKRGQRQRRSRKSWVVIAAFVVVIIGAVVGAIFGLLGGKETNDEKPAEFDVNRCYSRSEELSERYDSFRSKIVSLFPDMATAIDSSYSSASVALCWVSDFDEFELEIPEGNDFELIQRFVLTAVYYHFEGTAEAFTANQFLEQDWLSGLHVCKWGFVECDNSGEDQNQITGLSVDSARLTGKIPTELAMLKHLLHLGFMRNSLTGSIPSELFLLTLLNDLNLSFNPLTGSIPSQLGLLIQLSNLNLSFDGLTGSIPSQLGLLTRLDDVDLRSNKLTGSIPSQLGLLTRLDNVDLHNNELTGSLPSEIGVLNRTLTLLDLKSNFLTGSIPSELGLLTQLTLLELSLNSYLTGSMPSSLCSSDLTPVIADCGKIACACCRAFAIIVEETVACIQP